MQTDDTNYSSLIDITDELLQSKGDVKLYVGGNSMYPHLQKKDYVTVAKRPFESLQKGDVIVFKRSAKYVAHRIIRIVKSSEGRQIITKGDSCKSADSPILKDNYIGKIIGYERCGHYKNLESRFNSRFNLFLASISPYTQIVYSTVRFFKHLLR